jgi:two-component system sensor histidine kinase MtrB
MTGGPVRPLARRVRRAPGRVRARLRYGERPHWRPRPALVARSRRLIRLVRRRWRRSMRLRVVATTMVLGLIVVVGLGNYLLARIRDGLVEAREASAMVESEKLAKEAQELLTAAGSTTVQQQEQNVNDTMFRLESSGSTEGRGVLLQRAQSSREPADGSGGLRGRYQGVSPAAIPQSLREAVNERSRQQVQITTLPVAGDPHGKPAIAVGTLIDVPLAGLYELYFIYPLDREQDILDLVRRTFLVGGGVLVLLVGAVAYTVTRQVVAPVRLAARTAEELASGRLDRRMRVRGEDDMARLGRAFNEMAGSLERQIHRLEELSRVQRRFVSDVSHELRTPLTTIRMASEVLHERRHEMDPTMARSAELLQAQLDRFEALLSDLLEISRFDAGAAVLEVEPADVREVVGRVVDVLAPLAERRSTLIRVEAPLEPCLAEIDARRVERIVRNLLANAIEHGEGRPIDVRVAASTDAVAVGVLDRGSGIDPSELAMVFNRFWRADPARARSTGGTGLGLAIAQEDAHLHGGWLQAWGEPGIGANFRLTLPRRAGVVLVGSPLPLVPYGADPSSAALDLRPPSGQAAIPGLATPAPLTADPWDGSRPPAAEVPVDEVPVASFTTTVDDLDVSAEASARPAHGPADLSADDVSADDLSADDLSADDLAADGPADLAADGPADLAVDDLPADDLAADLPAAPASGPAPASAASGTPAQVAAPTASSITAEPDASSPTAAAAAASPTAVSSPAASSGASTAETAAPEAAPSEPGDASTHPGEVPDTADLPAGDGSRAEPPVPLRGSA